MKKQLANWITILRMFLILAAFLYINKPEVCMPLYIIAVISDGVDGFIARKFKTTSILGARLDTIADLFLVLFCITYLYNYYFISTNIIFICILIFILKISAVLIYWLRFEELVIVHTYLNKLTGVLLYFLPMFINNTLYMYFLLGIAIVCGIEEIIIAIKCKRPNLNLTGYLQLKNMYK